MIATMTYFDQCPKDARTELEKFVDVRSHDVLPWIDLPNGLLAHYASSEGYLELLKWAWARNHRVRYIPAKALRYKEIVEWLVDNGVEKPQRKKFIGLYGSRSALRRFSRGLCFGDLLEISKGLAKRGNVSMLKYFINLKDGDISRSALVAPAISGGNIEMFKFVMEYSKMAFAGGTDNLQMAKYLIENQHEELLCYSKCICKGNVEVMELLRTSGLTPSKVRISKMWRNSISMDKWLLTHHPREATSILLTHGYHDRIPISELSLDLSIELWNIPAVGYLAECGVLPTDKQKQALLRISNSLIDSRHVRILKQLVDLPIDVMCMHPEEFPERVQEILDYQLMNYKLSRIQIEDLLRMGAVLRNGFEFGLGAYQ